MQDIRGRRLLLLGGSLWGDAIKTTADSLGITLLAAGNNTNAEIFKIAEEGFAVDSTDHDVLIQTIRDHQIDGVYVGGNEAVIRSVCSTLQEIGIPCYCTPAQWDQLQNKSHFKSLCIECGLPVVPQFALDEVTSANFPVITKPVDGSGSKGFSICSDRDSLLEGYEKASSESPSGSVIIEKYVKNDGVVVFYTVSEGKIIFSGLEDKYPVRYGEKGSYVGGLFIFESYLTQSFRELFESKIQHMVNTLGIREGSFWIEVFTDGDLYYFNEVGYRYGGSASVYPVNCLFGVNQVGMDMYYALTGESCKESLVSIIPDGKVRKQHYAVYPVYAAAGTIACIKGMDELEAHSSVIKCLNAKKVGDTVKTGNFGQVVSLVHFVFDTKEELIDILAFIHDTLKFNNQSGENLVVKLLDAESLVIKS